MFSSEAEELCHLLASLNYDGQRTIITPDRLCEPSFDLSCDILDWCAKIAKDNEDDLQFLTLIPDKISRTSLSDSSLIAYLSGLSRLFLSRLGVRIDVGAILHCDAGSCSELLKIVKLIHNASMIVVGQKSNISESISHLQRSKLDLVDQLLRLLDEEKSGHLDVLEQSASELDNLLEREEQFSQERRSVIERQLEGREIEQVLKDSHEDVEAKTKELLRSNEEMRGDLVKLDEKLSGKEAELQKETDRLNDLLIQSPAYMDKYNQLNERFEQVYDWYVSKFRNYTYLKSVVYCDDHHQFSDEISSGRPTLEADSGATGRDWDADTTGPAKLAESLAGASKPMFASSSAAATVGGAATGAGLGLAATGAGATGLTRPGTGRRTYIGRTELDAAEGLNELEGLLKEFVADSEEAELEYVGDSEPDEEPDTTEDDDDDGNDDDDEDDALSTELLEGLAGRY